MRSLLPQCLSRQFLHMFCSLILICLLLTVSCADSVGSCSVTGSLQCRACSSVSCGACQNATASSPSSSVVFFSPSVSCGLNVCMRCVGNSTTQVAYSPLGCSQCGSANLTWYQMNTVVGCSFFIDAPITLYCTLRPPNVTTTAPVPQLSQGAVAGIIVALFVCVVAAITLYCFVLYRQNPSRFK